MHPSFCSNVGGGPRIHSQPVHISSMERQFWPSFWTLVDGNNELQEISLHYHVVPHLVNHSKNTSPDVLVMDASFLQWNRSNLKSNIVSFWKGKCRKHYFRISIVNALPVNYHPTVIAVDGRTSFKHNVNGPSVEILVFPSPIVYILKSFNFVFLIWRTCFLNSSKIICYCPIGLNLNPLIFKLNMFIYN